jgi:hypothetical protein
MTRYKPDPRTALVTLRFATTVREPEERELKAIEQK